MSYPTIGLIIVLGVLAVIIARAIVNYRRWQRKMKRAGDAVARRSALD